MSKQVTYSCNLCKEKTDKKDLICMYWKSAVIPQAWYLSEDLDKSDNHICKNCITLINKETVL